ncbi:MULTISPECIES: hypothetical protein [Silvimonas]|uniref:Lipoprotein n=2 Tax=Silvimonas TaxID=300264 RepID=A0ABQ2PBE8_9NEIS|nr:MULTISPECIES: hypothetical protein [Silvimonas]GGP22301.1 hypothetical protein GCM10010970_24550 [Silvimonas iriomotensis]GGP28120.1 hypothetical protein GCM10010971_39390 [Silvimonas amylolytica]
MRFLRIITTLVCLSALFGCATGSSIVTGKTRPAVSPSQVNIYLDPPSQFETIGIVEASSEIEFSTQAAQDRAINELKSQAAKLGANGVLLMGAESKSGDASGFYSGGVFYATASEKKVVHGKAIFLTNE